MTFGEKVIRFHKKMPYPKYSFSGIEIIDPFKGADTQKVIKKFYSTFFNDNKKRVLVLGINPGRFGSGSTGVQFTDAVALEECGIPNSFPRRRELTSEFIYKVIEKWGGPKKFYSSFFLSAISPVGFTKSGLNYNYYDDRKFFEEIKPFIIDSLRKHIAFGVKENAVIIIGTGKNLDIFNEINAEYKFFKKVYAVEHPRFIMQYKRKEVPGYITKYLSTFKNALK